MGLVSRDIPGLFNGISQQSPSLRLPNQCEEQINFHSSVVRGVEKRQGTDFKAVLESSNADVDTLLYAFTDSEDNQYLMLFTGDATAPIEIYKPDGTPCTVTYDTDAIDYLDGVTNPKQDLRVVTIADYTMVVNRNVTCAMDESSAVEKQSPFALYWCKKGINYTYYYLGSLSKSTGASNTSTGTNTNEICSYFATNMHTCTHLNNGSVCRIADTEANIKALTCSDSYGNTASLLLKGKAEKVEDLPNKALNGDTIEITGEKDDGFANYWVKWVEADNLWQECTAQGIPNAFDAATMPHQLIRTGETAFFFRAGLANEDETYASWDERTVGDEDSAPTPSFIGNTITDIFFYKNRLGVISGQNVLLSRPNDYFNFFPETATDTLDTDPIDMTVSSNEVEHLLWACYYNEDLLLFAEDTQYLLTSGAEVFTTTAVTVDPSTTHQCSRICEPVVIGSEIYFVSDSGDYSKVLEYFVQADSQVNDAAAITAHCDRYIPSKAVKIQPILNQDTILVLTDCERDALYVYKWYWTGQEKPQSAWYKFSFDYDILDLIRFGNEEAYLLVAKDNEISLETLNLAARESFLFDRRTSLTGGVYDSETDTTEFTLPYTDSDTLEAFKALEKVSDAEYNHTLVIVDKTSTSITVENDYSTSEVLVGKLFPSLYTFSEFFMPGQDAGAIQGRLQLKTLTISFNNSCGFELEVTPKHRETQLYDFTNILMGEALYGEPATQTGRKRFFIRANATGTTISLINNSYLPSIFDSASWEGIYITRSQSLG